MTGLTREQQNAFLGATIGALGISSLLFPCSAASPHIMRLLGSFMTAFAFQLLKMNSMGILAGGVGVIYASLFDFYQKKQAGKPCTCCAGFWLEVIVGFFMFTVGAAAFCADKAKEAKTGTFPSSASAASSVAREASVASPSPAKKTTTRKGRSTSSKRK